MEGSKITLKALLKEINGILKEKAECRGKHVDFYIDSDVSKLFDHKNVNSEKSSSFVETNTYFLRINSLYSEEEEFLRKEKKYIELTLLQGLQEIIKRIKNGYFENQAIILLIPLSTIDRTGNKRMIIFHWYPDKRFKLSIHPGMNGYVFNYETYFLCL